MAVTYRYWPLVDNFLAKESSSSNVGSDYIFPAKDVCEDVSMVDFFARPSQLLLKLIDTSDGAIICQGMSVLDQEGALQFMIIMLKRIYYLWNRERPWRNLQAVGLFGQYLPSVYDQELGNPTSPLQVGRRTSSSVDYNFLLQLRADVLSFDHHFEYAARARLTWLVEQPYKRIERLGFQEPLRETDGFDKNGEIARALSANMPFVCIPRFVHWRSPRFPVMAFFPIRENGAASARESRPRDPRASRHFRAAELTHRGCCWSLKRKVRSGGGENDNQ